MSKKNILSVFLFIVLFAGSFVFGKYFYSGSTKKTKELSLSNDDSLTTAQVKTKIIDLGKIKQQDQAIAVNYVIYNTGTNDLYIRDVKPDCKCTAGVVDKTKPIQPGDSTQVTLKYGPKHPGVFQVSAVVEMNARQSPLLLLRGEVVE